MGRSGASGPYYSFGKFLRDAFGEKVYKISVDAGFTCPNRDGTVGTGGCIFCDPDAFSPASGGTVAGQIASGAARVREKTGARKFLAYFQPNTNTHAPVGKLEKLFREALGCEGVVGLAIGTRPDSVGEDVLSLLEDLARGTHLWVEYGLQSAHDRTLRAINRGHDFAAFEDAVLRTRNRGIYVCAHVILGLPGETRTEMLGTVRELVRLEVDAVKLHHLHVVKNTPLVVMYERGELELLSFDEYADVVADVLEILPPETVVQRLFGWTPREYLVAPDWGMGRRETHAELLKRLRSRNSWQGKSYSAGTD